MKNRQQSKAVINSRVQSQPERQQKLSRYSSVRTLWQPAGLCRKALSQGPRPLPAAVAHLGTAADVPGAAAETQRVAVPWAPGAVTPGGDTSCSPPGCAFPARKTGGTSRLVPGKRGPWLGALIYRPAHVFSDSYFSQYWFSDKMKFSVESLCSCQNPEHTQHHKENLSSSFSWK